MAHDDRSTGREGRGIVPARQQEDPDDIPHPKPRHGDPGKHAQTSADAAARREIGEPGGGAGRRDDVGRSGIYPVSGDERPPGEQPLRPLGDWSTAGRYPEGYEESGGSELIYRDGILLGGLTDDPDGRPSIDIHRAGAESDRDRPRKSEPGDRDRKPGAGTDGPGESNS